MVEKVIMDGLTFDDVLLLPAYSEVMPHEVELKTQITRNMTINVPLISAAMDSVTEARTAIAMAREGGIGVIHRNLSIERQALEVAKVKKSEWGMIVDPITISPEKTLKEVWEMMQTYTISGIPVTIRRKLVGIITHRDLRFETGFGQRKVKDLMTSKRLITAKPGISMEEAKQKLHKHRIEKLPVIDEKGNLVGLITTKDIEKGRKYPNACKDPQGRLIVAAAIGTGKDRDERVAALLEAGADAIAIDTAHGNSKNVLDVVRSIKRKYPKIDILAGNVATPEGADRLIRAGADGIKVGVGPGSICTTRIVAGVGVPQISAIFECAKVCHDYGVPCIADGGIKYSGDVVKAIAAGADAVMVGSLLAGTDESPGDMMLYQGRYYKQYRGMGSIAAMLEGSKDRYFQESADDKKLVPEGIEGRVPYKGKISDNVFQLLGGLRAGMGYAGCKTIEELQTRGRFVRITPAGLRESHVHDVVITKEAPNYRGGSI